MLLNGVASALTDERTRGAKIFACRFQGGAYCAALFRCGILPRFNVFWSSVRVMGPDGQAYCGGCKNIYRLYLRSVI